MESQKKQWTIRPFQREDGPEVLSLLNKVFSKDFTPEWFKWRYESVPFGEPVLHVAESFSGQIAGFRALWYWPLIFEGKEIPAYQVGDLAVAPDFRGQGIMLAFGKRGVEEAEKRGVWLRFGFANASALPGALKLGYRIVDRLAMWAQVMKPTRFIWNTLVSLQRKEESESLPMDRDNKYFLPAEDHIHDLVELREKGAFSGLRSLRSEKFYTWRLSHPHRPCHLVSLDGRTPLMMIHLQKERIEGRALLMEHYIPANSSEWKAAVRMMRQSGKIDSISTKASHCPEGRGLDFLKITNLYLRPSPTLIVQVLRKEAEPFLSKALWDLSPLDMDFC